MLGIWIAKYFCCGIFAAAATFLAIAARRAATTAAK